jgi:uncharacterized protein YwqG
VDSHEDLQPLSTAELVRILVETVQLHKAVAHIGRKNRLMDRRFRILAELGSRDQKLQCLRGLLEHSDPSVRFGAACAFRSVDAATCERILSALAMGDDEVAWQAQDYLRYGFETQGRWEPREQHRTPGALDWQIDNPPPLSLNFAEIRVQLDDVFPPEAAARLLGSAEPAIGLWPRRARVGSRTAASRFGGMPDAPPEWNWPRCEAEPMLFLGQFDCNELQGFPAAKNLPPSGLLSFFGDHDAVMSGARHGDKPIAVFHWPETGRLAPATPALGPQIVFPVSDVTFYPLVDLPDPGSYIVKSILSAHDRDEGYRDIWESVRQHGIPDEYLDHCSLSRLFGWPHWEQGDYNETAHPADLNGLRLLLQLDSYSNGLERAEWGDHGALYFLMRDADLRRRLWDRCEFEMQCG